jgi:hypothetical protein
MAAAPMGRLRGTGTGRRLIGGPARYAQYHFLFIQMDLNSNWLKVAFHCSKILK